MLQTDKYYRQPTVFKLTTAFADPYIQLDTFNDVSTITEHGGGLQGWVKNIHMRVVSYVSNNAASLMR